MKKFCFFLLILYFAAGSRSLAETKQVVVGSKSFTENVILGELATNLIRSAGVDVQHQRGLGSTRILWSALLARNIDIYADYTGTIRHEIPARLNLSTDHEMVSALAEKGISITKPFGFNNTYAIGVKENLARTNSIQAISELAKFPDFAFGFSNEFMDRKDG